MESITKGGLTQFVEMMTNKGWVNPNTGAGYKAALNKVLADIPVEEDVRKIDVKTQVLRYNNLHPGELSPPSLKQYEKRVTQVIAHFISYKTDPTKFKPPQRVLTNGKPEKAEKPKSTRIVPANTARAIGPSTTSGAGDPAKPHEHEQTAISKHVIGTATEKNLALPFPLRPNYLAQIVIPRDMTKEEADRLCTFIQALAQAPATA